MKKALEEIRMVQYLSRRLLPLAAGIGLLLALLGPLTFWIIEHRSLHHMTDLYADELADEFQRFALEAPTLWKYQAYKFNSVIDEFHPAIDVLGFRVLDEKGAPINGYDYKIGWKKHGRELTFVEDLSVTLGSAPIIFNNRRVGSVEVLISDARLQRACALQFFFSALIGTALAFLVYRFPVRVVRKMEGEISGHISTVLQSEEKIRRLNDELELMVEEKTRQLLDAQEELVRKEKLATLGQLSGSVGHELRNPLAVMSNAVYFLKMVHSDGDETTNEYLDMIKHEIENSQRIISDLLDFARTKPPQTKAVTANELVEQSVGRCTIPGCVTLLNEAHETLPPLQVDPLQMGQVLHNLITNAIQAMPDGGTVRINARLAGAGLEPAQSGHLQGAPLLDFIEISVEDTGEGISEENISKLFQPLFTTKAKGIGLGLVVCRNLVESNGGRIEVESLLGGGATFTVTLPVGRE